MIKKTILIVEDDLILHKALKRFMEMQKFQVDSAYDGAEAINLFQEKKIDLVVLDLGLPKINGMDVLEFIVNKDENVPVIILSGTDEISEVIQAMRKGAWDFVHKPFESLDILYQIFLNVLKRADLNKENIEYNKKLEQNSQAARNIQNQLLPNSKETINAIKFSSKLMSSIHTTGDFLDYFKIDDSNSGFYFADVSGHGLSSSFITVFIKNFFDRLQRDFLTKSNDIILNPAEVLNIFNKEMEERKLSKYITIMYGVINSGNNILTCVNAGQYPLPLYSDHNKIEFMKIKGFPLGIFEFSNYENYSFSLPKEFFILFISDGFLDLVNEKVAQTCHEAVINSLAFWSFLLTKKEWTIEQILTKLENKCNFNFDDKISDDISFMLIQR